MDLKDRRVLAKIREEARLITNFIDGLEIDGFLLNELIKRAVALTLANIGELCTVLSDDVKQSIKTYHGLPSAKQGMLSLTIMNLPILR